MQTMDWNFSTVDSSTIPSTIMYEDVSYSFPNVTIGADDIGQNDDNISQILLRANEEEAMNRLAVMIYLGLVAIIGTIGNIHVIVVYYLKFQKSNNRTFVLALAIVDTIACLFCMTFEIFDMRYPYMFYASTACRIFRYNNTVMGLGSAFLLVVIAIERYRKICRPLKRQMTYRAAKVMCLFALIIAIILSIPAAIMNGHRTVNLGNNVTGVDCTTNDETKNTKLPFIFGIILMLLFIVCLGSLLIIYSVIGKKLFHQIKIRKTTLTGSRSGVSFMSTSSGTDTTTDTRKFSKSSVNSGGAIVMETLDSKAKSPTNKNSRKNACKSVSCSSAKAKAERTKSTKSLLNREPTLSSNKTERKTIQATKVFFVITVAFLIVYFPHISLAIATALNKKFVLSMNPLQSAVHRIAMRLYYVNNAINPIIYGFCGGKFRKHCKELYSNLHKRLCGTGK